jgi:vacuolar-type H+-ATPase subunit E/Vma4
MMTLLADAIAMFPEQPKLQISVRRSDVSCARKSIEELGLLNFATFEGAAVVGLETIGGGVIVESADGFTRVDNSYDTRLTKYFRTSLSEVDKALFRS